MAFLVAQMLKNLTEMQETWFQSLGQEDILEQEIATHSSIVAWRIPGMGEPGGLPSMGSHRVGHDWSDLAAAASAYLRLLIFLPVILIPACASSSPAFLMMYSTYKLNKQGDNI